MSRFCSRRASPALSADPQINAATFHNSRRSKAAIRTSTNRSSKSWARSTPSAAPRAWTRQARSPRRRRSAAFGHRRRRHLRHRHHRQFAGAPRHFLFRRIRHFAVLHRAARLFSRQLAQSARLARQPDALLARLQPIYRLGAVGAGGFGSPPTAVTGGGLADPRRSRRPGSGTATAQQGGSGFGVNSNANARTTRSP